MAIVTDPDNIDRDQIVFGTNKQKISIYDVGAKTSSIASAINIYTSAGTQRVHASTGSGIDFTTWDVSAGDVIVMRNGPDAAHLIVSAVTNASIIEIAQTNGFTAFSSDPVASGPVASSLVIAAHVASGGSTADGVTKQALYSFGKEEWRVDDYSTMLSDDLIRHEFPWEAITREQMELGGGEAHADWTYFNEYTRKKIRTGGWKDIDTGTASAEYAGIITLGAVDSDAQIYYQQVSAQNTPVDFTFLGAVNEPIDIYTSAADDRRSFLKLFVRKKARTYAQSEIADIGVTQLETIVNRFPLAHAADAAITVRDSEILGTSPYRAVATVLTDTDGETATASTFRDNDATFTSTVVAGDTLKINAGVDAYTWTVLSVVNASVLRIDTSEYSFASTQTGLDYDIFSPIISARKTGGNYVNISVGSLSATSSAVGVISAAGQTFQSDGVAGGDLVIIASATSDHEGVYPITSVISETTLQLNTTDNTFTTTTGVDFRVVQPGMYLQYKKEDITITGTSTLTFASTNASYGSAPTIARASGSWVTDGVSEGTFITFASTTNNNDCFTIASVQNASVISLVAADRGNVVDGTETAGASIVASDGFKRTINSVIYSFNWRLLGNSGTLAQCYQFVQHQLRQITDIDYGENIFRGDVTDLLMDFASPTGTTHNMVIDSLDADDTNNVTYEDACGDSRTEAFVATFTISHNNNLQNDSNAKVRMMYASVPNGAFSTKDAVTVTDATGSAIAYSVGGAASRQYSYDYDGNTDGGRTAGTNAKCKIVGIGLDTAQYVVTSVTITRTKGQSYSLVSPLERNYQNV